ncbi:calcium-binding protein [Pseudomonas sp. BN414]|uniref:calcium-binding protein n=1 Tax=Pseudomonas sp. BN414 TaxID=2567888 RepID=UPI002457768A|nr:calcium-binding protein [Pseudomonas sp. BN414]
MFNFQWQSSVNGVTFTNIPGANTANFTPGAAQAGLFLRVVTSYVDDSGFNNSVASAATGLVGALFSGGVGADTFLGTVGDDIANGGDGNDVLWGALGNDTLNGDAGDDFLIGGDGADTMAGGAGNDTYGVDNALDLVNESAGGGTDMVLTILPNYTLAANLEILQFIGSGSFIGFGNELNNGLFGGAGNDFLIGGEGADAMVGGGGDDTYGVDNALDNVIEFDGGGTDFALTILSSYTLAANVEMLEFIGSGSFTGFGNDQSNSLFGAAGNDVLIGEGGADAMVGRGGDDIYGVDNALDTVIEFDAGGTDSVLTTLSSYTLGANVENLMFLGSGSFNGTGNELNNGLIGGASADVLTGGAGNDSMVGGLGNDTFVFAAGFGNDSILDFDSDPVGGQDLMNIAALGITAVNFATSVGIADLGENTQVTIGTDSITLVGVADATTVTQADFIVG